jgi:hypothetical protein
LGQAATVLIAVKDAVLADSLRFSLELEGYHASLCALPFDPAQNAAPRACLLIDQDVFAALQRLEAGKGMSTFRTPTILMVNQPTMRLLEHAREVGVTSIVEKPLLGGVLLDAIRTVLEAEGALSKD